MVSATRSLNARFIYASSGSPVVKPAVGWTPVTPMILTKFGETFQYSNQMVATGGYAAAAASGGHYGRLYEQYVVQMRERIFASIGMNKTTFSFEEVIAGANYAQPHSANLAMQLTTLPYQALSPTR